MGHRQPEVRALPLGDRPRGHGGLPHLADDVEQERAARPQDRLGFTDLGLHQRAVAQELRRRARDLDLRQLHERVDGGAGDTEPHAAEAAPGQIEPVHAVHRAGDPRAQIERRERALLGHEEILHLDVVAPRAA